MKIQLKHRTGIWSRNLFFNTSTVTSCICVSPIFCPRKQQPFSRFQPDQHLDGQPLKIVKSAFVEAVLGAVNMNKEIAHK